MEVNTNSKEETQKVGADLARDLGSGDVIALFGKLGAGKTTFVQGLAKALGIKRRILSPTFVFVRSYPFKKNSRLLTFHHLDLYRGQSITDFNSLGLGEIFDKNAICVIEWADKIEKLLPKKRIDVFFEIKDDNKRLIKVEKHQ